MGPEGRDPVPGWPHPSPPQPTAGCSLAASLHKRELCKDSGEARGPLGVARFCGVGLGPPAPVRPRHRSRARLRVHDPRAVFQKPGVRSTVRLAGGSQDRR